MWTIKSFQNKKSTHADDQGVTALLILPVGDVKTVATSEFPGYRGTNMECIWGESPANPPIRPELGWGCRGFK